jgi:hypothetical protein
MIWNLFTTTSFTGQSQWFARVDIAPRPVKPMFRSMYQDDNTRIFWRYGGRFRMLTLLKRR